MTTASNPLIVVLYGSDKKYKNCLAPLMQHSARMMSEEQGNTLHPNIARRPVRTHILRLMQQQPELSLSASTTLQQQQQHCWSLEPPLREGSADGAEHELPDDDRCLIDAVLLKVGQREMVAPLQRWIQSVQEARRGAGRKDLMVLHEPRLVEDLLLRRDTLIRLLRNLYVTEEWCCTVPPSWLVHRTSRNSDLVVVSPITGCAQEGCSDTGSSGRSSSGPPTDGLLVVGKPVDSNGPSTTHDMAVFVYDGPGANCGGLSHLRTDGKKDHELRGDADEAGIVLQQFALPRQVSLSCGNKRIIRANAVVTTHAALVYKLYLIGGALASVKVVSTQPLLDQVVAGLQQQPASFLAPQDNNTVMSNEPILQFNSQTKELFQTVEIWTAEQHGDRALWGTFTRIAEAVYQVLPLDLLGVDVLHVLGNEEQREDKVFWIVDVNYWPSFEKAVPNASERILSLVATRCGEMK